MRLGPVALAKLLARRRRLAGREHWTRERLEAHQAEGLRSLRTFAVERSPFYRDVHAGRTVDAPLSQLPVLTKQTLMERWNDVVTDRMLDRDAVLRFVESLQDPERYAERFFVATTSGTTGRKGLFVYDQDEWLWVLSSYARANDWAGVPAGLTHRLRLAVVSTTVPWHQSAVVGASLQGPLVPTLRLDATQPTAELVAALNRFRPESLVAYAGMAERLAHEQTLGNLRIAPRTVFAASEVLTGSAKTAIRGAFGVEPFETYAATETASIATECRLHRLHLYEDLVVTEVVDADDQPVQPGSFGSKVLATVLFGRTVPLIRYEITDRIRLAAEPCSCGLPFAVVAEVDGRKEDLLQLDGSSGRVQIQPGVFADALERGGIDGWQVIQDDPGTVRIRIVPGPDFDSGDAGARVEQALRRAGADRVRVNVEETDVLEQTTIGKTRLIQASTPIGRG